ncbi:MAG: major intrinsic protein [Gemmatimonadetes bacterium]|jgi:MIP family channel proteins|nr:major intrinsic protein [Gemmatimonadota bacterium]
MRDSWRHFVAEFIGVFALVFIGGATILSAAIGGIHPVLVAAIAHGLILSLMITATMRISGHLNPAVTIGFLVTRRIGPVMAVIYIIAQLLGSLIASYALKGLFPAATVLATRLGGQFVAADVTTFQAITLEAIATFFLVFVVFGTAVDPHAPKVGGFAIGLTVTADILAIGSRTGASMNPARSFGPAVVSKLFEGHLVYWIGPIIGGIAAALLYDGLFLRRGKDSPDHGALEP